MNRFQEIFPRIDRNPLTYRTLWYVLLCTTAFALLSTAAQLYIEYRRDKNNLYENIELIEKSYLPTISASVYKIDTEGLLLQLNGALKLTDIVHLKVVEQRGAELIETSAGDLNANKIVVRKFDLIYKDSSVSPRKIGSLTISASLDDVYRRLFSRALTVLATNAVKTFLASAGILAIIYWLITRHLIQISDYTRKLVPGSQDTHLSLNRRPSELSREDELDQVVSSINSFQERLREDAASREAYEERLRQAEQKYRTVADFNYDWEYWINTDGSLEYVSPSCERITGHSPEEFIAAPSLIEDIVVPEDRTNFDHRLHGVDKTANQQEVQFRIRTREGNIRWIEHVCQSVVNSSGESMGVRVSNRDITARKKAEFELRDAYSNIEKLKQQLEAESSYLQEEIRLEHNFDNIIGNSAELKYVLYKVEKVAPGDTTVLILGESGTGKELIARAIHNRSPRGDRPFIKVNCAALPAHLIESELFGHERGAFTGAHNRQRGRFEIADGTSIFLDEIGELPLDLQAKLLRVLQDGEFERLGSTETKRVDVRVITATNRDLEEEVQKGNFREDLFYRLNVYPVTVPPLRLRTEDVPLLTQFFVDNAAKRLNKKIEHIPNSVIQKLQDYSWPGNVRELINILERAVINSSGTILQLTDNLTGKANDHESLAIKSLQEIERDHIIKVLQVTNWRIGGKKGAAVLLEINPSTLRSRMKKLNINTP